METPSLEVHVPGLAVGWVIASGCTGEDSPPRLRDEIRAAVEGALRERDTERAAGRRAAVRDMLRRGTYKPTGRGKPASEYLLRAAEEGDFPSINRLADINNLVSIRTLLPISLVDIGRAGSRTFRVRLGREGEEYAFNPSGQVLKLQDLVLAASMPGDLPRATPVKDSQATKTHPGTSEILGLVYAPATLSPLAVEAAGAMEALLREHCGCEAASSLAVGPPP